MSMVKNSGSQNFPIGQNIGEELRLWVKANYPSLKEFEKVSGVPYSTLMNYVRGERKPTGENLLKLIHHGFPIGDQKVEVVKAQGGGTTLFKDDAFTYVMGLDVVASAGTGAIVYSEEYDDGFAFQTQWLRKMGILNAKLSVIQIRGNSMDPTLSDGDLILVRHECEPIHGKISVIRNGEGLFAKRMRLAKLGWIATSDNPSFEHIEIDEDAKVVGNAVCAMKTL